MNDVSNMRTNIMIFSTVFWVFFWGLGPKVSQGGPRDPPRVPPGSKLLQSWSQNDSKIINKCCPEAFWKRFSKTHALSMFLNSSGLFLVCSYSCRGRLSVTLIQVKSQHSSTWLGGKTYGGCLSDASQTFYTLPQRSVWGLVLESLNMFGQFAIQEGDYEPLRAPAILTWWDRCIRT